MREKWQYMVVEATNKLVLHSLNHQPVEREQRVPLVDFLNEAGSHGWEVVGTPSNNVSVTVILKRHA